MAMGSCVGAFVHDRQRNLPHNPELLPQKSMRLYKGLKLTKKEEKGREHCQTLSLHQKENTPQADIKERNEAFFASPSKKRLGPHSRSGGIPPPSTHIPRLGRPDQIVTG